MLSYTVNRLIGRGLGTNAASQTGTDMLEYIPACVPL